MQRSRDDERDRTRLPPGPRLPRVVQTTGFMFAGPRFLEACRRRYGDAVTFRTLFDSGFVMVFDPALVKELFQGPPEQLHAGEANAMLGPDASASARCCSSTASSTCATAGCCSARSTAGGCRPTRTRCAHRPIIEIDSWPVGEPFSLLPSMQSLTLRVIMRAVFGYEPGRRGGGAPRGGCAR